MEHALSVCCVLCTLLQTHLVVGMEDGEFVEHACGWCSSCGVAMVGCFHVLDAASMELITEQANRVETLGACVCVWWRCGLRVRC
jgi:hypothetical protein